MNPRVFQDAVGNYQRGYEYERTSRVIFWLVAVVEVVVMEAADSCASDSHTVFFIVCRCCVLRRRSSVDRCGSSIRHRQVMFLCARYAPRITNT
jgi:hypothetical protein